jgi:hypothetical protein
VAIRHVVRQGECLPTVALQYGFHDHRAVYHHPDNAELRKKRPDPGQLFPGDVVAIPERALKEVEAEAGRVHRYRVKAVTLMLRITFRNAKGEALGGEDYSMRLSSGREVSGTTDGDGLLEEAVFPEESSATLLIDGRVLRLQLGHLNPLGDVENDDLSGIQARLRNLGYEVGPADGRYGRRTRAALALLQSEEGLEIDGLPSEETLAKLEELHGC